ncbi:MAG: hypothetical protein PQJ49_10085 [Sphaerochaetaceae bacterium]|jgi:hypothetical protein|nr:hypothetical protein [Sphaerochaetaceae bacterium]MDC7236680.1 hypothetical protein [Sphaerochaetaceae bacterium]MDC7250252.1 hypothetical protein [Sphaerochaetaceae bacterium]
MKKILTLAIISIATTASLFALSSGVITLPTSSVASPTSSFNVEAKASESDLGLLLKYGETSSEATLVEETITKDLLDTGESWDVFGVEQTGNFYFFGIGRASSSKNVNVKATASEFSNGDVDTGVTPEISGYDSVDGWNITIAATNDLNTGTYANTQFYLSWDGTDSSVADTAPAGTYTSQITLTVTDV